MQKAGKVRCFLLCVTALLGMIALPAAGASFLDEAAIQYREAASFLTDLNIMPKRSDGSFGPAETVTRAELCQLICLTLNSGKEPSFSKKESPYPDVRGHWGASYIEYCRNLGIVAGRGDGSFGPDDVVTGVEATKMLLVMIGYEPQKERFTGSNWADSVLGCASKKGFYKGMQGLNPLAPLTREQTAQLLYQAIHSALVEYQYHVLYSGSGELQVIQIARDNPAGATILSTRFQL